MATQLLQEKLDQGTTMIDEWYEATEDPKAFVRAWCYVCWNPEDVERLESLKPLVHVVGQEICPRTGKDHWQGYIRFKEKVRFSFWVNQFPDQHFRARKRTEPRAANYCRKDKKIVYDYGTEGSVDPTLDLLRMLEQGCSPYECYMAHPKLFANGDGKWYRMRKNLKRWKNPSLRDTQYVCRDRDLSGRSEAVYD